MNWPTIDTVSGTLERPLTSSGWHVPDEIWMDGRILRYRFGGGGQRNSRVVSTSPGLLEGFVRLADAPRSAVLQFAQSHGMLGVKKRADQPKTEDYISFPRGYTGSYGYSALEIPLFEGGEPFKNWLFWARKLRAALNIGSFLGENRYGKQSEWDEIFDGAYGPPPEGFQVPQDLTAEDIFVETRMVFYQKIEEWIALGHVQLDLNGEENRLYFGTHTLFSGLVLQLAMAVCGSDGFAICSSCKTPYAPKRFPAKGRRHYCQQCGRRAAVRDAVRRHRRRVETRKLDTQTSEQDSNNEARRI